MLHKSENDFLRIRFQFVKHLPEVFSNWAHGEHQVQIGPDPLDEIGEDTLWGVVDTVLLSLVYQGITHLSSNTQTLG